MSLVTPFKMVFRSLILALLSILCGCGGGNSSSDQPAVSGVPTRLVAGFVEDGPIVDARLYLVHTADNSIARSCGASGSGSCETRSDDRGHFSFLLNQQVDPGDLLVVARGGSDGSTGLDLSSMEACTALGFFAADYHDVVVSPLTTMVTRNWQSGKSLQEALSDVTSYLKLGRQPADLLFRPGSDAELQNRALLLSKIASELSLAFPGQEPFSTIASILSSPRVETSGSPFPGASLLNDLGLSTSQQKRIGDLQQRLAGNPLAQEDVFVEEELFQGFSLIAERSLSGSGFDPLDAAFVANGQILSSALRQAVSPDLVPLNGVAPQRLARYLLHTYGLKDASVLTLPTADFTQRLQGDATLGLPPLSQNTLLRELANLTSVYSVQVALLADEMPGDDSALRRSYYYNSDLSHFHQAEKLVGLVSDDAINDPLMVAVVDGMAAAGLFSEAEKITQTQVYQSVYLADAWLELARSEVEFGQFAAAKPHLDEAYAALRKVLDNQQASQLTSHESLMLASIAANYRKAGYLAEATTVLNDLQQLATAVSDTSTYGKLFVGVRNIAEDYLATGDLTQAAAVVDDLLPVARLTPANVKVRSGVSYQYFKLRVFNLREVMRLYAELGLPAEVLQVFQEIQALRSNDGLQNLTLNETWYDASQMVETLYSSGHSAEALNLANSIPASYSNYYGASRSGVFYQNTAFMSVATWEALNNGYPAGLAVLNAHFSKVTDLVEGLTYFALNSGNPRIGLSLLNAGRLAEAVQALDEATLLLDGLVETTDLNIYRNLIEHGYVKVAKLYVQAGDLVTASNLLGKAEGELHAVVAAEYRNDGYLSIALGYHDAGMTAARDLQFSQAFAEAQAAESLVSELEATQLYDAIAAGLTTSDQREGLLPAVVSRLVATAGTIHDPVRDAGLGTFDNLAKSEIHYLLAAAGYYNLMKDSSSSLAALETAEQTARELLVDTTRMAQLVSVAGGYAEAGFVDKALSLAESLPFLSSRNEAFQAIAESFTTHDDFPGQDVASVDTDGDGLPNFWSPLVDPAAIDASGLTLDPDCDNDGIPDLADSRPLFVDP